MKLPDVKLDKQVPQQGEVKRFGYQNVEKIGEPIFLRSTRRNENKREPCQMRSGIAEM